MTTTITASQVVTWVRDKLGDTSFDEQEIIDASNWFVYQLFFNTQTRLMEATDILYPSTADTTTDMPDDYMTLITINVISPQIYELKNYHLEQIDFMKRYPGWNSSITTPGSPSYWTDFNNQIRWCQPLDQDYEISIDYCRTPTPVVSLTDTYELPDIYQELLVEGTLARCMQTNEDYPEASQELANLAPMVTAFIRRESRGNFRTGPVIMRSNRRRGGIRHSPWSE